MDLRDSFSRLKNKFKRPSTRSKYKPGRTEAEATRSEGVDRTGSPPGPEVQDGVEKVERVHPSPLTPSTLHNGKNGDYAGTSTIKADNEPDAPRPNQEVEPSVAVDKNESSWKSTASATAGLFLRTVKESSDAIPPLKSIAGGLCAILENSERTAANKQAIESLAPRVRALSESLCAPISESGIQEESRRKMLEMKLEDIRRDLTPLAEQGEVMGFLTNVENARKINGLVEDIRDAIVDYQTSLQQDIYDKGCRLIESADIALLNAMHRTPDAGYRCGNRQGCLRGTRNDVLREIQRWLTGEQERRIFWLNGLAGTGKSTIAQTFAETTFADGNLGASFFCSRDFEDRSNLQAIFPTLAHQLAYRYPLFRKELLQVLRVRPDVGWESLCSQMESLIVGPFKATGIPTLIIIDALDECKDEEPASAILSVLSRYVNKIPNVKFFITGRPEPRIRTGFRLESLVPITEVLKLHEVKPETVDGDIELFLRTRLTDLVKNRSDCDLAEEWPSSSDIEILCKKAAGFFIYASTAIKFIASENDPPSERLALVTSLPQSTAEEGKSGVDQLYVRVLEQAFHGVYADNVQFFSRFRAVVGTVLLVFNPLSIKGLSELLGHHPSHIRTTFRPLHSLLLVPDSMEGPILAFHKSFHDFLTDPGRCEDNRFFVESTVHHTEILLLCLSLMKERLRKNICNLDDHAVLSEVKDLSARQKDSIGDTLEYACCFWTKHLLRIPGSSSRVEEVRIAIDEFFTTRLLWWIEVLALTGNLGVGVYAMNNVERWYASAGGLCKWTTDSQRFILKSFDGIRDSPSYIYYSAVPFSPSSSWLHQSYAPKLSREVKVIAGLPPEWGTCSRTVLLDSIPLALACWKDVVAVGLQSRDIIFLDAITGGRTAILSGHTGWVTSLAFSSDGTSLVSGSSDKTVSIWDVQTGGVVKTFHGHTGCVSSVSISSDCNTIASGSVDQTIHLWCVRTGECCRVIEQHEVTICVNFSPTNPRRLLSVSGGKVWQWDIDGHQIGPTYDGSYVTFSSDGTRFVSCQGTVATVRNSDSGTKVSQFFGDDDSNFEYCCFSPDGKSVATSTVSPAIYVWDVTDSSPNHAKTFLGHTSYITSLALSPFPISASHDRSVRFWKASTPSPTMPAATDPTSMPHVLPSISSITLRTGDGIAISTHSDGVVKTWDLSTGLCKTSFQTPAEGPTQGDTQLIDGALVFVWWADEKIYVWGVEKGELLRTVDAPGRDVKGVRLSGDGSKVFCLDGTSIRAWCISTGEVMGKAGFGYHSGDSLTVDESRVWVRFPGLEPQGWDFGFLGSSPIPLSDRDIPLSRPHLDSMIGTERRNPRIKDLITGKEVLQLSGRFADPVDAWWDGQYLVAGYGSGIVLILDFVHVLPSRDS